jgi:hypothetical protein
VKHACQMEDLVARKRERLRRARLIFRMGPTRSAYSNVLDKSSSKIAAVKRKDMGTCSSYHVDKGSR